MNFGEICELGKYIKTVEKLIKIIKNINLDGLILKF